MRSVILALATGLVASASALPLLRGSEDESHQKSYYLGMTTAEPELKGKALTGEGLYTMSIADALLSGPEEGAKQNGPPGPAGNPNGPPPGLVNNPNGPPGPAGNGNNGRGKGNN